jgi:hypothetical protein
MEKLLFAHGYVENGSRRLSKTAHTRALPFEYGKEVLIWDSMSRGLLAFPNFHR